MTVIKLGVKKLNVISPIGVYDWEKNEKRRFNIDIELEYDIDLANLNDDLLKTINYEDLVNIVEEVVKVEYNLIETVVNIIGQQILHKYQNILQVKIRMEKLNALGKEKIKYAFVEQVFYKSFDEKE